MLQTFIILFIPWVLTKLTYRLGTQNWLSPVVLSYVAGIVLCNFTPWELDNRLSGFFTQATIVLAIPLLLYSTDLPGWFRLARATILSFVLVIVSVIIGAFIVAFLFREKLPDIWVLSAMLTGVFIGGTPNMNAVGIAMGADENLFIALNATEIICGGTYLVFLTSAAHRFYGLFLKKFTGAEKQPIGLDIKVKEIVGYHLLLALGLTLLIVAIALGMVYLLSGSLNKPGLIILSISALSVAASFSPTVRYWKGSFEMGEYLLLMFCVAIGMMADLSNLFAGGGTLLLFTAASWLVALTLHFIFCKIFNIDRDTMMITQTAGFYGPPFIGQVAAVIQNRALVFSGIMTGLVGLSVANFIGVGVANLLKMWLEK